MTFRTLADAFLSEQILPIEVNSVLDWIKQNTDHKEITLHGVERDNKAYRGAFRRKAIPSGMPYSHEYDIITQILYGIDLPEEWKRLVIVKEALHVFDPEGSCVVTPESLRQLIPAIISRELGAPFIPALNDHFGAFKAMAVMLPRHARNKLGKAIEDGSRTVQEVAHFVRLPEAFVDIP